MKVERYVNAEYFHSLAECQEYASFFPLSYQGKWNPPKTASKGEILNSSSLRTYMHPSDPNTRLCRSDLHAQSPS